MNTEVCLIRADTQPAGEAGKQPRHCRPPRAQRPDPSSWPPAEPHPTSGAPTDAGAGDMVGCRIRPHGSGPATILRAPSRCLVPHPGVPGTAQYRTELQHPRLRWDTLRVLGSHVDGHWVPRCCGGLLGQRRCWDSPVPPSSSVGGERCPVTAPWGQSPQCHPRQPWAGHQRRAVEIFPYPQHQVFFAVITTAIIISFGVFSCHNLSPALIYSAGLFREGSRRNGAIH